MNDYEGQKPFVNGFNEQSFRREILHFRSDEGSSIKPWGMVGGRIAWMQWMRPPILQWRACSNALFAPHPSHRSLLLGWDGAVT
eukprot:scaffold4045_cov105-Skeletonema_dohrnii-CCMP3373.AAC.2